MTDINDYSSPHDAADEARAEEPDGYYDREPVDLDEVEELIARRRGGSVMYDKWPAEHRLLDEVLPALVDELKVLRDGVTGWMTLPTREEWAVTARREVVPSESMPLLCESADSAAKAVKVSGGVLWVRRLTVHPWEPIADQSPF